MGSGQRSNKLLVQQALGAMEKFKYEIANELNIDTSKIQGGYWGYVTSRETGAIGGNMVRRMIEAAERSLAEQTLADVKAGFQAGMTTTQSANTQNANTYTQGQTSQSQFKFQ